MSQAEDTLRRQLRRVGPHHLTLLLLCLYLGSILSTNEFDPFALIRVGTRFDPSLGTSPMGYDGQFAFQIALDPIGAAPRLDIPAYRYQRILYPLLARAVALGRPTWIPWSMVLINMVAVALGTWATARILTDRGQNQWFALAYPFNVGMLLSLRLDLNEPLAFLFVQLGYLSWLAGKRSRSALAFALAALAKEVTIILGVGLTLQLLLESRWREATKWSALAFFPFALWQLFLRLWQGSWGPRAGGALASSFSLIPYRNWWSLLSYDVRIFLIASLVLLPLVIIPASISLYLGARRLLRGRQSAPAWGLTLQSAVYLFLPSSNLLDPLGVTRFGIGLITALLVFGAYHRQGRVLAYSQLWILTIPFALGDNFVPGN